MGEYLRTALLVAGIVLAAWVVVRYWAPKAGPYRVSGLIRVVARYPLEPRKALYVVELASEYFLIGSAENSLQSLGKLDAAGLQTWISSRPAAEPKPDFRALFRALRRP